MVRLNLLGSLGLTDGRDVRAVLAQPKRFALLAYLALAEPRGLQRRDLVVAMFWPDRPDAQARAALRRSLHFLRLHLGDGVIVNRGEDEVGVAADHLSCDAVEFEQCLAGGRLEEALGLYRGDFMAGVFVADASPDIDQWVERRRRGYCDAAFASASALSDREWMAGRITSAREWAQRALDLSPLSEPAVHRLLRILDAAGERTAALQMYDAFRDTLRRELDVEPNAELRALVESLRSTRAVTASTEQAMRRPSSASVMLPLSATRAAGPRPHFSIVRRHPALSSAALLAAIAALAGSRWLTVNNPPEATPVFAVGALAAHGSSDSASIAASMPELLATGLGTVRDVQVISRGRLYEVSGALGDSSLSAAALLRAARGAGAKVLIEGEVYSQPTNLRLDLRLVDLRAGIIQRSYTVRATTPFQLADSAVSRLADGLRRTAPTGRAKDLARISLQARRYFDDGLRAYYRGALPTAETLFGLALAPDSTYAMALYFDARTRAALGASPAELLAITSRALRAVRGSTGYEELLIRTYWTGLNNDPSVLRLADSLMTAFPYEPEAYELAGEAHWFAADYAGELRIYHHLADIDAISIRDPSDECPACLAMRGLAQAYMELDSLEKALSVIQRLARLRPRDKAAWSNEVAILGCLGRRDELLALMGAPADRVGATADDVLNLRTQAALRLADFAQADRDIGGLLSVAGEDLRDGLWLGVINDRVRGRLVHARAKAERLDAISKQSAGFPTDYTARLTRAQTALEGGEPSRAAAAFDTLRRFYPVADTSNGFIARQHVWMLAHQVTALAAAGDTARLARFVDTLEQVGRRSNYARDQRMHHYARGLLGEARGHLEQAVAEYQLALTSRTFGYTRINYALARTLLKLGRPGDAVAALQPVLRAGFDASNFYLTMTEAHELLAHAFEAQGARDSAFTHYQWVATAWRDADAPLRLRGRVAADKARRLRGRAA